MHFLDGYKFGYGVGKGIEILHTRRKVMVVTCNEHSKIKTLNPSHRMGTVSTLHPVMGLDTVSRLVNCRDYIDFGMSSGCIAKVFQRLDTVLRQQQINDPSAI